ncbi:MAG: M20/M25/M40 family metallo-hydrolase, partial [bacterium]
MQFRKILFIPLFFFVICLSSAPAQEKFDAVQLVRDLRILASDSLQGRKTGTVGSKIAQEYIERAFGQKKLLTFGDSFRHTFSFVNKRERDKLYENAVNIVGYVKGREQHERFIVISAHYDHVGVQNGIIYNGADDNASGVAAMLAAAAYFSKHQPHHSIIFTAFDAEELGLRGAKAFVANPPVSLQSMILNVNLDMVSRSDKNELYVSGTYHYPRLKQLVRHAADKVRIKVLFGHDSPGSAAGSDWTYASDHGPF